MSTKIRSFSLTSFLKTTALCAIGGLVVLSSALARPPENTIVVFAANWCATCRDAVPIIQNVASENGLNVNVIDVDAQDAPKTASSYGLSIPKTDIPQAYLISGSSTKLILDGRNYSYGQGAAIRATLLTNLQQARMTP